MEIITKTNVEEMVAIVISSLERAKEGQNNEAITISLMFSLVVISTVSRNTLRMMKIKTLKKKRRKYRSTIAGSVQISLKT